jgi:hypothetical protein
MNDAVENDFPLDAFAQSSRRVPLDNNNNDATINLSQTLSDATLLSSSVRRSSVSQPSLSQSDLRPSLSLKNTEAFANFIKCTGQTVIFNDISYAISRCSLSLFVCFLLFFISFFLCFLLEVFIISYTVGRKKKKRSILKGINGCFRPGQLSVIMGSTGATRAAVCVYIL